MTLVEKYRPKTLDEVVGHELIIKTLKEIAKKEEKPHLLFSGPAGVGKTTTAIAFAREVFGANWIDRFVELNASDERGIDTVREKIKKLAESKTKKIVFLDECDALTTDAQQALRRIMEKSKSTIFILSCNWEYKIIDPIKSRCARFVFGKLKEEEIAKYLLKIIKSEGILINDKKVIEALKILIEISDGDMRKALNTLEQLINSKKELTPENILMMKKPEVIHEALDYALEGDFTKAKEIIEEVFFQYDTKRLIYEISKYIDKIQDEKIKIKLFEKLAELDYRIQVGSNPLVQVIGFLAFCWIVKHVPDCPIMNK